MYIDDRLKKRATHKREVNTLVKTQHIDTELLNKYIEKSGLKIGYIVETLGISRQAFDRKRNGFVSFKAAEVYVLCDLLKISQTDKPAIFLLEG